MSKQADKKVACPTCGKMAKWSATNRWRPFCSERCRLIDLGMWLDEEHRIEDSPEWSEGHTTPSSNKN